MKRRHRSDANQTEIVKLFRKMGATVAITSQVGNGFPDIVVGYRGKNYLVEIKDGNKPPSERKLTPDEQEFFDSWKGSVFLVETENCCISLIGDG